MIYPPTLHKGGKILLVALSSPLRADDPVEPIAEAVE